MFYMVKTPGWLRKLYKNCVWELPGRGNVIYLTFDDGPHPEITDFVLDQLAVFNAHATFFCIGKNVVAHPQVYQRILAGGHAVGNHTFNHFNGWKTASDVYLADIGEAQKYIDSTLFRPPYGRITRFQLALIKNKRFNLTPVMWTVLSGDFDQKISAEKCLQNVLKHTEAGSIVVFHDSEKAWDRLKFSLPLVLAHFAEKGYRFEKMGY